MPSARRFAWLIVALAVALGGAACVSDRSGARGVQNVSPKPVETVPEPAPKEPRSAQFKRACSLPKPYLARIWRGFVPARSPDITLVPRAPHYLGTPGLTSHSGPWNYLQQVPLFIYGPERVESRPQRVVRPVSLVDVFSTMGRIAGVALPARRGTALDEVLGEDPGAPPKLIITIVWDGVGRNTLRRWPDAWPVLRRLEPKGVSYMNARVGSSPSITPSTHTTLATGTYPRRHGIAGIQFREFPSDRDMDLAFSGLTTDQLRTTTFGDEIDGATGNRSKVGLLAWRSWHVGMLGHGAALDGADRDEMVLIEGSSDVASNPDFYLLPDYMKEFEGIERRASELDRQDGQIDGRWLGHELPGDDHGNPAWVRYQLDMLLEMLSRGEYGRDEIVDLMFTNFKATDLVSHAYSMDAPEEQAVLRAQDAALGRLVAWLNQHVGDYVLVLTSDHGNTPSPARSGAWAIRRGDVEDDMNAHFDIPSDSSVVQASNAYGFYLNRSVMGEAGIDATDAARFLDDYRLEDNATEDSIQGYEGRRRERLFAAAFTADQLPLLMHCAFGTTTLPETFPP